MRIPYIYLYICFTISLMANLRSLIGKNKYVLLLSLVLFLGLSLRLYISLTRDVFVDEVFYTEVAAKNNIKNIILIKHWIKDHGILYYLFLKPFLLLTKNVVYLRLTNLILYLISSFSIFVFFSFFGFGLLSILLVFLYSFHPYFVFLNTMVSPFNLVFFFSLLSFLSLSYFVIRAKSGKQILISLTVFVAVTICGFYSDYSFFYMLFFYFFIFVWAVIKDKKRLLYIVNAYLLSLVFILPGIFQFINNLGQINFLFHNFDYREPNFFTFINQFARIIILRTNSAVSLICLALLLLVPFFIQGTKPIRSLMTVLSLSFVINTILLYLVINFSLSIFMERSFWFFYLGLIFLVCSEINILIKQKKIYAALFIFFIITMIGLTNYLNPRSVNIQGEVSYTIPYLSLIRKLVDDKQVKKTLILVDKRSTYYPLTNYFFSSDYPSSAPIFNEIQKYKKMTKIIHLTSCGMVGSNLDPNQKNTVVFFSKDNCTFRQFKNIELYQLKVINDNQQQFIKL